MAGSFRAELFARHGHPVERSHRPWEFPIPHTQFPIIRFDSISRLARLSAPLVTLTTRAAAYVNSSKPPHAPMTRETAIIVVIGILTARLKSFNAEAVRRRPSAASTEENGGEDWETRVICARNMPWRPTILDLERIFTTCPNFAQHSPISTAIAGMSAWRSLLAACQWRSRRTSRPPLRQAPAYPDHDRLMVVRDGQGREHPIQTLADWNVRRDHILAHFQEVAGHVARRRAPGSARLAGDLDDAGSRLHSQEDLVRHRAGRPRAGLAADSGSRAASRRQKHPAVLCLHQTIAIGKDEPAGLGQNRELAYARELAERGYVTLAPDYPNFGEYKINVYDLGYASATMKAIWNNLRAIDLLCDLDEVDPCSNRRHRPLARRPQRNLHGVVRRRGSRPWSRRAASTRSLSTTKAISRGGRTRVTCRGCELATGSTSRKSPSTFPELIAALAPRGFFTSSPLHDANFEVEGVRACITAARPVYELERAADRLVAIYPDAEHSFPKRPASRLIASWIASWHHRLDTLAACQNA